MRFKEFFTEAAAPIILATNPAQPTPQGYKKWGVEGKVVFALANMTGDQVSNALVANPALLNPQPTAPAPAGQSGMIAPPARQAVAPPQQSGEQPPPGYRFFQLSNGNLTAVPQQLNDVQALDLIKRKRPDLIGPVAQSMNAKKQAPVVIPSDLPGLPAVDNKLMTNAKKVADTYLGRVLTPQEWDHLIRATYAESGHQPKEDAYIMGTILNRARHGGFGGANISKVLTSPNQFQSVTGKPGERSIHNNFTQGPPTQQNLTTLLQDVVKNLPKVEKDIGYFVSNKEAAFTAGTNKGFAKKLKQSGGKVVGQSVFNKMTPTGEVAKPTMVAKK